MILILGLLFVFRGSVQALHVVKDSSQSQFVSKIAWLRNTQMAPEDRRTSEHQAAIDTAWRELDDRAWSAVTNRMARVKTTDSTKGKTLVIVTCPGGGIHAAAWAACVLDQLCSEYLEFQDSLCLLSGVSGGSVGTLLFVGTQYEPELTGQSRGVMMCATANDTTEDIHQCLGAWSPSLERAARSSLEAIVFGMAIEDLYGLFGVPGRGRGQRLEDSFRTRLPTSVQELSLGQWGDKAAEGVLPIVVFNTTDAVTGRRVLFDTIPTPTRNPESEHRSRPWNYRELMASQATPCDVLPATAARASASFPYISPFTRPGQASECGHNVAICDGGYVDNEGIVTAVNWVEFLLKRWAATAPDKRPFNRILIIRIEPSEALDRSKLPDSGGCLGAFRWLCGPMEAMMNVRSTSQVERGDLECSLAALYLNRAGSGAANTSDVSNASADDIRAGRVTSGNQGSDDHRPPQAVRRPWSERVRRFVADREPLRPMASESPQYGAVFYSPDDPRAGDIPVVVQTIAFCGSGGTIPLNWKLSKAQKIYYLAAWERASSPNTLLRQLLDRYFTRDAVHDSKTDGP